MCPSVALFETDTRHAKGNDTDSAGKCQRNHRQPTAEWVARLRSCAATCQCFEHIMGVSVRFDYYEWRRHRPDPASSFHNVETNG